MGMPPAPCPPGDESGATATATSPSSHWPPEQGENIVSSPFGPVVSHRPRPPVIEKTIGGKIVDEPNAGPNLSANIWEGNGPWPQDLHPKNLRDSEMIVKGNIVSQASDVSKKWRKTK